MSIARGAFRRQTPNSFPAPLATAKAAIKRPCRLSRVCRQSGICWAQLGDLAEFTSTFTCDRTGRCLPKSSCSRGPPPRFGFALPQEATPRIDSNYLSSPGGEHERAARSFYRWLDDPSGHRLQVRYERDCRAPPVAAVAWIIHKASNNQRIGSQSKARRYPYGGVSRIAYAAPPFAASHSTTLGRVA